MLGARYVTAGRSRLGALVAAALLTTCAALVAPVAAQANEPVFLAKWGSVGDGDGQFAFPTGVATDAAGNVYVADQNNHNIQRFDSTGAFLAKWGSFGSGDGQFAFPFAVGTDAAGNVYVADSDNHRIQKFDSTGTLLTKWGTKGAGDGQFSHPFGVASDAAGNVYVADLFNDRVQKFDSTGAFLAKWGTEGAGDGQFNGPVGVATDAAGNVYVADTANHRIQKFDSTGTFLAKWGSFGAGDGQLHAPGGVATDGSGNVYVAEVGNHRIQKFDPTGTFLTKWGSEGAGDGQFNEPHGVATDAAGHIYVVDSFNRRIQKFGFANQPPSCTAITVSPSAIYPPARDQMKLISLSGATDPDGDPLSYEIDAVSQDEPVVGAGDETSPDAQLTAAGAESNEVLVRAERNPKGNGRVYRIAYTVSDGKGGSCSRTAGVGGDTDDEVSVPRKKDEAATDDGDMNSWNSLTGASASGTLPAP